MIQEIIPGDGRSQFSVAAYCKDGHVLASMSVRRTRQYPINYGLGSTFVEAIEVPALFEPAQKLLSHMHISGMVEVEFKYDARDGQYKLLDINVRPWGWHTLSIACGLDFPYMQYCDLFGQLSEVEIPTPRYGYHWIRLLTDIPAGLHEIQAGITTPGTYLGSLLGKTVFSVLDWRDPLPAFGDFASAIVRAILALAARSKPSSYLWRHAYPARKGATVLDDRTERGMFARNALSMQDIDPKPILHLEDQVRSSKS
jgi:D-aspartate ligase